MEDTRVWQFEKGLWTGGADHYREAVDDACVMVLPTAPFVLSGSEAIESVADTPRWSEAEFSDQRVQRPQEGLIVIAYSVRASKEGADAFEARCTSTYRRLAHEEWRVVQHQQTPITSGAR